MKRLTKRVGSNVVACKFDMDFVLDMSEKEYAEFMKLMEKLAYYEDAEEERRLVILPCKVGDTVYSISGMKIQEEVVSGIEYCTDYYCLWSNEDTWIGILGNCVYLTRDESESALEKMKGD